MGAEPTFSMTTPLGLSSAEARARRRNARGLNFAARLRPERPQLLRPIALDATLLALAGGTGLLALLSDHDFEWLIGPQLALFLPILLATVLLCFRGFARGALAHQPEVLAIRDGQVTPLSCAALVPGDAIVLSAGMQLPVGVSLAIDHGLVVSEDGEVADALPAGEWILGGHGVGLVLAPDKAPPAIDDAAPFELQAGPRVDKSDPDQPAPEGTTPRILRRLTAQLWPVALAAAGVASLLAIYFMLQGLLIKSTALVLAMALLAIAVPPGLGAAAVVTLLAGGRRLRHHGVTPRTARALEALAHTGFLCVTAETTLDPQSVPEPVLVDAAGRKTIFRLDIPDTEPEDQRSRRVRGRKKTEAEGPRRWQVSPEPSDPSHLSSLLMVAQGAAAGRADPTAASYRPEHDPDTALIAELAALLGAPAVTATAASIGEPIDAAVEIGTLVRGPDSILCLRGPWQEIARYAGEDPQDPLWTAAADLEAQGHRVLAVAAASPSPDAPDAGPELLVQPLGLVALRLRIPDALADTAARLRAAKARVAVASRDPDAATRARGVALGIVSSNEMIVTGPQLIAAASERSEGFVDNLVRPSRIFSEAGPEAFRLIVDSYHRDGHQVTAIATEEHDRLALVHADVGVAVPGPSRDALIASANALAVDGSLQRAMAAITAARATVHRVRKLTLCALGTGAGLLIAHGLALFLGVPMPLLPVPLIAVAMIVSLGTMAVFALETEEGDELDRISRRASQPIFPASAVRQALVSALAVAAALLAVTAYTEYKAMPLDVIRGASAVAICLIAGARLLVNRRDQVSLLSPAAWSNPLAFAVVAAMVAAGALLGLVPPIAQAYQLAPVPLEIWPMLGAAALAVAGVEEVLRRQRLPDRPTSRRRRSVRRARV